MEVLAEMGALLGGGKRVRMGKMLTMKGRLVENFFEALIRVLKE
ncbi:MAG: hypothetical protein WA056_06690 [Gallionella sp.]